MKSIRIMVVVMIWLLAAPLHTRACSPSYIPFRDLLNRYWPGRHSDTSFILVYGYYLISTTDKTPKFKVTRCSDSSLKINQEYSVWEYGPFGSHCERYEMKADYLWEEAMGSPQTRLLLVYKTRSKNGKIVLPIFGSGGARVIDNKLFEWRYDGRKKVAVYKCTISFEKFWKRFSGENYNMLKWKKQKDEPKIGKEEA